MNKYLVFTVTSYYLLTIIVLMASISQNIETKKEYPYYEGGNNFELLRGIRCPNGTDSNTWCLEMNITDTHICHSYDECGEDICELLSESYDTSYAVRFQPVYGGAHDVDKSHYCQRQWSTKFKWTVGTILWLIASFVVLISLVLTFMTYKTSSPRLYYALFLIISLEWLLTAFSFPWYNIAPMMWAFDLVLTMIYLLYSIWYLTLLKSMFLDYELQSPVYSQL